MLIRIYILLDVNLNVFSFHRLTFFTAVHYLLLSIVLNKRRFELIISHLSHEDCSLHPGHGKHDYKFIMITHKQ